MWNDCGTDPKTVYFIRNWNGSELFRMKIQFPVSVWSNPFWEFYSPGHCRGNQSSPAPWGPFSSRPKSSSCRARESAQSHSRIAPVVRSRLQSEAFNSYWRTGESATPPSNRAHGIGVHGAGSSVACICLWKIAGTRSNRHNSPKIKPNDCAKGRRVLFWANLYIWLSTLYSVGILRGIRDGRGRGLFCYSFWLNRIRT